MNLEQDYQDTSRTKIYKKPRTMPGNWAGGAQGWEKEVLLYKHLYFWGFEPCECDTRFKKLNEKKHIKFDLLSYFEK